jgi:hypothetical protein
MISLQEMNKNEIKLGSARSIRPTGLDLVVGSIRLRLMALLSNRVVLGLAFKESAVFSAAIRFAGMLSSVARLTKVDQLTGFGATCISPRSFLSSSSSIMIIIVVMKIIVISIIIIVMIIVIMMIIIVMIIVIVMMIIIICIE